MSLLTHTLRAVAVLAKRLRSDSRGNIALMAALIGPGILLLGVGAVDLWNVSSAQGRLQSIADAGALAGAPQLALATDGSAAKERAASFVGAQMSQWDDAPTYTGTYEVITQGGQRAIRVQLNGHRPSFFANMLPPGGWNFSARSTASSVGLVPLCVLVNGGDKAKGLLLHKTPRIIANGCMVHSNQHIEVKGGSIAAARVQSVGTAVGVISPKPGTGAAPIPDPFAGLNLSAPLACDVNLNWARLGVQVLGANGLELQFNSGVTRLPPGAHCGAMLFTGTSELILEPGDHWFKAGVLSIRGNSTLTGRDVVLLFDNASKFVFKDQARINLTGRESGPFAGLVMGTTRGNDKTFEIGSDFVEALLGVVYVPSSTLYIDGSANVARESAWTVIVAKYLELGGSPTVYINANYGATRVPVPAGVGQNTGVRLVE